MIEVLGSSPINSVMSAGRGEFMSIFRKRVSTAFSGEEAERYSRAYTSTRGLLINKEYVEKVSEIDLTKGYQFQFNPQTVSDVKNTLYEVRPYAGLAYNDYIWGGGGERVIAFQLFMDNTPQSKQGYFRPNVYNGSKKAWEFVTEGTGYTYDENTGRYTLDKGYFGKGFMDELKSQAKTIKESVIPSKGPSKFEYKKNDAYSKTRVCERGVLPEVELIQSFLYPAPLTGEETPKFAEGGVVSSNQFRPPATAILTVGPIYVEGVVKAASVNYTLFDIDLTPIRATVDVEFAVFEFTTVERRINNK